MPGRYFGPRSPGEAAVRSMNLSTRKDWLAQMNRRICKWYPVCPMKRFYEEGKLEKAWVEKYCFGNNDICVRYQMEESGEPHPDNLLPDGEVRKTLQ